MSFQNFTYIIYKVVNFYHIKLQMIEDFCLILPTKVSAAQIMTFTIIRLS